MEFINMLGENAVQLWIALCIVFLIIEQSTLGLTTIWFSIGALVALLSVFLGASFIIQIVIFLVVSLILLLFTRKIFVKKLKIGNVKTNVDAIIGTKTVLVRAIIPYEVGSIKINGQEWSAVCEDRNVELRAGTKVEVVAVEGVKAIVRPIV